MCECVRVGCLAVLLFSNTTYKHSSTLSFSTGIIVREGCWREKFKIGWGLRDRCPGGKFDFPSLELREGKGATEASMRPIECNNSAGVCVCVLGNKTRICFPHYRLLPALYYASAAVRSTIDSVK